MNNLTPANYSVRLGNGAGGFSGSSNVTLPYAPYTMSVGDFNGDNFPDFSASTWSHNTIIVRYGNGTGSFTGTLELTDNVFATGHVIGDFNEDNIQDIIGATNTFTSNKQISLFLGTSNEINVTGNGNGINDGSNSVSAANNTDFGIVNTNNAVSKIFTIQNTGSLPLLISNITITGAHSSDFSKTGIALPYTLPANSSVDFTVTFTPQAFGVRTAVVHVFNNDCNEADYDFAVQGTYCVSPVFTVCPGNLNVTAAVGFCRQAVSYTATVSGSPSPVLSASFTGATTGNVSGTGSGTVFNTGTTHIVITASNICSAITCVFDIVVSSGIDDNNACTFDACNTASGSITNVAVNTDDMNVCTVDGCNTLTGSISHIFSNADDGNVCTTDGCHSATGNFHLPADVDDNNPYTFDGCNSSTGIFHLPILTLKVFLEGFYSGNGLMDNYGAGGCLRILGVSGNIQDVDTLFLTLVDALTLSSLETSSSILKTDGTASFIFNNNYMTDCYLKLRHRNSIETWSSIAISPSLTHFYDFTLSASKAYGNNLTEVFDHQGWAVYGGDVCNVMEQVGVQDGLIDGHDYTIEENAIYNTNLGYVVEDLTGDGISESADYVVIQNNYYFTIVAMRP